MAWRIVRKISVCAIALVAVFGILDNFSLLIFDADATASDLDASATIGASATIALNTNNVAFSILPSSEGTFGKSNALVVSTYTNNDYNCDVTMIADSANLTNGSYTIPSLATGSTYTESTFTNDSWGYQIESGNYKPVIVTEAANPIKTITTMTGSIPDTTNIYFAAKFTTAVKAGDYTNTITFGSTCAPPSISTYMQDQTASTLATLLPNVGDTTTLYDKRDENGYAVTKLVDGYYWMTQNLRLGKGNGEIIVLDSTNSDLPSGATFNLKASGMGDNQPDATGDCNVGNWYLGNDDETETNTSHLCINTSDTEAYGVYYNWYTATAGTGTYSLIGEAAGSICPKNWILPPNDGERSYENLLFTKGGLSYDAASVTAVQTTPYNFSLPGATYGEGIVEVGDTGIFWEAWSGATWGSNYLSIMSSNAIFPSDYGDKGGGYSVRCVFGPSAPTFAVTASMDSGVSSVVFTDGLTTQIATSVSPTVFLKQGVSYTVTADLVSGYGLSNWSTTSGGSLTSTSTNPTIYTATGIATLSVTSGYAISSNCDTPVPGVTYMQDFSSSDLSNLATYSVYYLIDSRDDTSYCVSKLMDGNLWMLDNLRLGSTSAINLTSSDTNLPSGVNWTLPASGTVCFSDSSCTGTDGTTTGTGYTVPAINSDYKDTVASTTYGSGSGKIGVYYNYCAASAGNICTDSNSNNGSADRDICPKGWRVPIGGLSGSEYKAIIGLDSISLKVALSTPLSGIFYDGLARSEGVYGYFWSATRNNNNMFNLYVDSSYANTSNYSNSRVRGISVRCILK